MKHRATAASRRLLAGSCLAAAAACSTPGGYTVRGLNKIPAATLTYPASSNVVATHSNGTTKNFLRRGNPAAVGLSATTTGAPTQVIAYFSRTLSAQGWTQTADDPSNTNVPGRTMHTIEWANAKLAFGLNVWTDPTTNATDYDTRLMGVG